MISHKYIGNSLLLIYILMYFSGQAIGNVLIISLSPLFALLSIFFLNKKTNQKSFLLILLLITVFLFLLLTNNHYPPERLAFNLFFLMVNMLIAFTARRESIDIKVLLLTTLSALYIFFFICLFISILRHEAVYVYMDEILVGFSYNYISGYLILATSLLMIYNEISIDKKISEIAMTSLILLLVSSCFLLYGRSGIAFSIVLAVVHFRKYWTINHGLRTFIISIIIISIVLFFVQQSQLIVSAVSDSKFKEGLTSPRSIMLSEYINALDLKTLLVGVDMRSLPMIAAFNVNPHNSFINLHSMLGIVSIFVVITFIARLINVSIVRFYVGVLLFVYLLRGSLDTMIMPGVLDFIFLMLFSYPLSKIRKSFREVEKCTTI